MGRRRTKAPTVGTSCEPAPVDQRVEEAEATPGALQVSDGPSTTTPLACPAEAAAEEAPGAAPVAAVAAVTELSTVENSDADEVPQAAVDGDAAHDAAAPEGAPPAPAGAVDAAPEVGAPAAQAAAGDDAGTAQQPVAAVAAPVDAARATRDCDEAPSPVGTKSASSLPDAIVVARAVVIAAAVWLVIAVLTTVHVAATRAPKAAAWCSRLARGACQRVMPRSGNGCSIRDAAVTVQGFVAQHPLARALLRRLRQIDASVACGRVEAAISDAVRDGAAEFGKACPPDVRPCQWPAA